MYVIMFHMANANIEYSEKILKHQWKRQINERQKIFDFKKNNNVLCLYMEHFLIVRLCED